MGAGMVIQFNVPNSNSNCSLNNPPIADQFPVPLSSSINGGPGNDWAVMTTGTNNLGQTPFTRYGVLRPISTTVASPGQTAVVTGYGVDLTCTRSQTQQTSSGPISQVFSNAYTFQVDVRGGNSGSALMRNDEIIGIVTHCPCPNIATRIDLGAFAAARASLCPGDTTPPVPDPMTFSVLPAASGTTAITMTATTATDSGSPPVSYFFDFLSGGSGGTDSGWQSSPVYTDTGLSPGVTYTYRVKARDSATTPNETGYSQTASATTDECAVALDCDDGDACNGLESCAGGLCQSGTPLTCDDGNACTQDVCDAVSGCVFPAVSDGTPCDDGVFCTVSDACMSGVCVGGGARDCSDAVACTVDVCDEASGACVHTVDDGACDDGNDCTDDVCDAGLGCQALPVAAGVPCVGNGVGPCSGADVCDGAGQCDDNDVPDGENAACDDGDVCTVNGCVSGSCGVLDVVPPAGCARRVFMTPYVCGNGSVCDPTDAGACGGDPSSCQVVPPEASPAGTAYHVLAAGGDTVAYDVWVEETSPFALQAWQVWMSCSYGATSGEIAFSSNFVDDFRCDYVFPLFGVCDPPTVSHLPPTVNQGQCPTSVTNLEPRTANVAVPDGAPPFNEDFPVVTAARYLSTWRWSVSTDAEGVFTLVPKCVPPDGCSTDLTKLLDPNNVSLGFVLDPLEVEIPIGQCCDAGGACLGDMTEFACYGAGGTKFNAGGSCAAGDPCDFCGSDADCQAGGVFDDGDPCTVDACNLQDPGADPVTGCVHTCVPNVYGDIWPRSVGGDGLVEVSDALCVLAANNGDPNTGPDGDCGTLADNDIWPCPPGQDGLNEVGDLNAVLAASAGNAPCPSACTCGP
ncbi:MAG: hypothetical protein ACE5E6_12305, partial [Phycisphaerae bacterium]